jgi:hypothetical protein
LPLPVNGTIIVDISEADDIDIDSIPPDGVSIVVTNTTHMVTNNPVEISEEASGTPPANAEGLATELSVNTNENGAEGSSDDGGGEGDEGEESANDSDTPDDEEEE